MIDLKQLKEDVDRVRSMTPSSGYPDGCLDHQTLGTVLDLIEAHESVLRIRGYDKLKATSLIIKFLKESSFNVVDHEDYTVLDKDKEFACGLVKHLNKHGIFFKKEGK